MTNYNAQILMYCALNLSINQTNEKNKKKKKKRKEKESTFKNNDGTIEVFNEFRFSFLFVVK